MLNARVYDVAIDTPLQKAVNMSNDLNNNVYFKARDDRCTVAAVLFFSFVSRTVGIAMSKHGGDVDCACTI